MIVTSYVQLLHRPKLSVHSILYKILWNEVARDGNANMNSRDINL